MKKVFIGNLFMSILILVGCADKSSENQDINTIKIGKTIEVKNCLEESNFESFYINLNKVNSSYTSKDSYTLKMKICKTDSDHVKVEVRDTLIINDMPKINFTSSNVELKKCGLNVKENLSNLITSDINRTIALYERKDGLVDFYIEVKSK